MNIRSSKNQEKNDKNNYNIIYQKIKEEIKNIVITKLLNQIQNLYKKYEKLKNENLLIKNDLIYILKRVLLTRNDYININNNKSSNLSGNNNQSNYYSINGLKNTSYFNSKSYNSFYSSTDKVNNESNYNQLYYNYYNRNNNNSTTRKQIEKRRYSIDDDCKKANNSSSYSHLETSLQFNIQNKIDYYLNSLYKHNFSEECATGTSSVHLLNKNQSIYDELFSNKNNRFKSLSPINTDINFKKVSQQKDRKNLYNNNDNESKIKNRNHNMQKNQSNYLKVHRRGNIDKSNSKLKINGYNKPKYGSKSSSNMIYNSNSKNHNYISGNHTRSRFLVNKF
jgi:hypothetical protein